jgi:sugar-specific transcriptional regulator TrmB
MALRDLGFSQLQEAAYRTLLADPSRDVPALAALVRTGEDAVRAALADLAEMGAIRLDSGAPAGFSAGDPSVAIGELIERMEDETLRRQRRIGSTRAELTELTSLQRGRLTNDAAGLETVARPEDVRERLAELSFFTRSSVFSIQPAGPHSAVSRTAATRLDQRSLRRGVDMRIIYDVTVLGSERNRMFLRHRMAEGARIRLRHGPLQRLIIMDERVAVVPADPADGRHGALIVQQVGLLHRLLELFRQLWDSAQDVQLDDSSEWELAQDDRATLRLLSSGVTDEMAATQVGISVRHFRRRVARLMHRLQADSRFQAGATAARRGWI